MTNDNLRIRDKRKKGWFSVDNDYLDEYAKVFGTIGTAIYLSLCRHADNNTQSCWPSQKIMAEECCISERTVRKHMKILEQWNLVKISRGVNEVTRRREVNVYYLLDKSVWKKPMKDTRGNYIPVEPEEYDDTSRRNMTAKAGGVGVPYKETKDIKETHVKDTHKRECCFEEFWYEYPRHENKKGAEAKWNNLGHELHLKIIADVKKRKVEHGQWLCEKRYIPSPTTYLNEERWNDDIIQDRANQTSATVLQGKPGKYDRYDK